MQLSQSSLSPFLCLTSAVFACVASCGGDDGACGPGAAADDGLLASADQIEMNFGSLTEGLNNDCPGSDAPAGIVSMTIEGTQRDGSGSIALCVSRPDQLATMALPLGPDVAGSPVRVITLRGSSNGCTFKIDSTRLPTGTASAAGLCGNGSNAAGFALTVNGAVPLTRTCVGSDGGSAVDQVDVTLVGTVAVAAGVF